MRFFNVFIIVVLAIIVYRSNGVLSFFEWCLAFLILWLGLTEKYSCFYVVIFIFSLGLSMNSLLGTVSKITSADEEVVYKTGVNRGLLFRVNECDNLNSIDMEKILLAKEEQYNNCSLQTSQNMIHHLISFVSAFYSGLYTEVAIVIPLLPQTKTDNKCLRSINKMIKLCPDEAVYYNKNTLEQLNRKYEIQ